jgi:hypothetical protein
VTFYRASNTLPSDAERFNAPITGQVVVVEETWLERIQTSEVWLYELPNQGFRCLDENAGYFLCQSEVQPVSKTRLTNLPREIASRGAQLRTTATLRSLAAEIAGSTLGFSIIRLHNASATK